MDLHVMLCVVPMHHATSLLIGHLPSNSYHLAWVGLLDPEPSAFDWFWFRLSNMNWLAQAQLLTLRQFLVSTHLALGAYIYRICQPGWVLVMWDPTTTIWPRVHLLMCPMNGHHVVDPTSTNITYNVGPNSMGFWHLDFCQKCECWPDLHRIPNTMKTQGILSAPTDPKIKWTHTPSRKMDSLQRYLGMDTRTLHARC